MYWFWDLHCAPADRSDPRASPLRGRLEGLPPDGEVGIERLAGGGLADALGYLLDHEIDDHT